MGFYGNISNTVRTQFQFDRIYSNRLEMEQKMAGDGVFVGRHVLIEYDSEVHLDTLTRVWIINGKYYTENKADVNVLLTKGNTPKGKIVYIANTSIQPSDNIYSVKDCKFYSCTSEMIEGSTEPATFIEIADGASAPAYTVNYKIDTETFGEGRGYDSTVWEKVFSQGKEKYINIAELNTVVPTFDVSPDAPTMTPVIPHFDTQSTDVYYKLHWQAPWGFRVKETDDTKSDEKTTYTKTTYDPTTGKNIVETRENVSAAIYFNEAGFDAQVDGDRESVEGINKHSKSVTLNEIKVEPTGKSGNEYNKHDGSSEFEQREDIQEMTINLPAIGNMMSDAWDIIHGPRRNDDMREIDPATGEKVDSLQGRLNSIAAIHGNEIPVKRLSDGKLVGTKINGDNNRLETEIPEILEETLSTSLTEDDAWIYTKIDSNAIDDEHNNGIAIHHTFHATQDSVSSVNKNDSSTTTSEYYKTSDLPTENLNANRDEIHLYTPYVDAAGHVVGKNIETVTLPYSYRTYETGGVSTHDFDIYTKITSGEGGADTSTASGEITKTIADQTQDTLVINPANKWIQTKFADDVLIIGHEIHAIPTTSNGTTNLNKEPGSIDEDNINIPDFEFDKAGHIIGKHDHKYTLPYNFKTITTNGTTEVVTNMITATEDIVADTTQDTLAINSHNKWIRIANSAANDSITLAHEVNAIDIVSNGTTNMNAESGAADENNINIPDWTYDEAGHITSKKDHSYTLPFGFKTITTNGRGTSLEENATGSPVTTNVVADTTQDTLKINSGNKWIRIDTDAGQDILTISHDVHNTTETTHDTSLVGNAEAKIPVTTYAYDEAGHYLSKHTETYALPYAFRTIKTNGTSTEVAGSLSLNNELVVADRVEDGLNVNTGNRWIKIYTDGAQQEDSIYFMHAPAGGTTIKTAGDTQAATPAFGSTFTIPYVKYDEMGHITEHGTRTVQIPKGSLNDLTATGSSVLTGISMTDESGAIVQTNANVGTLLLTDFNALSAVANEQLLASDNINTAFGKLEFRVNKEIKDRTDAINTCNNLISQEVQDRKDAITKEVSDRNTAITDAINTLDVIDVAKDNEYVSAVNETDGKISVSRVALPTLNTGTENGTVKMSNGENVAVYGLKSAAYTDSTDYATAAQGAKADTALQSTSTFGYGEEQKTIAELFNLVKELSEKVAELESRLNPPEDEEVTPEE